MSYARFGWDDSDVYVFLDGRWLECCGCSLRHNGQFYSTSNMLDHLEEHRAAGHTVPESCIERLKADADDNDHWINDENGSKA